MKLMPHILIVEDEYKLAQHIHRDLKNENYHIIGVAASFKEAMQIIHQPKIQVDIAIIDIGLEGDEEGGIKVAKYLQRISARTAIIFLTVHHENALEEQALKITSVNYLDKPYQVHSLVRAIKIAEKLLQQIPQISPDIQYITVKNRNRRGTTNLGCQVVKWVQVKNGALMAYISEHQFYEIVAFTSLDKWIAKYQGVFLKTHQSYVVNPVYITQITGDTQSDRKCYINGKIDPLPISRSQFTHVIKAWKPFQ